MITTLNGIDTIKDCANSMYRAHRRSTKWIGDYPTYADAERALEIANSPGALTKQRGIYDGGAYASDQDHADALAEYFKGDLFGAENPVSMDDVRRTILAGERYTAIGGLIPVRNA